jgi:hypothetical protein
MQQVYRKPEENADLCQGDIINAKELKPALEGHQDYMAARSDFESFCVVTQTCDLVRTQKPADYITLAVVRLMRNVFQRNDKTEHIKDQVKEIVTYRQNKRHYFYLPADKEATIDEPSVVDLRVTFALHKMHYQKIVFARRIGMSEISAANLGWMMSYVYSRIAMPEWNETTNGELKDFITRVTKTIKDHGVVDRDKLEVTLDQIAAQKTNGIVA